MDEIIELAIESAEGIIDCRLEPQRDDAGLYYAATILYPHIVGGYSRSEIYCNDLKRDAATGAYHFDETGDVHPKIKRLESQLSAAIVAARTGK
jgi:hypothetical protein